MFFKKAKPTMTSRKIFEYTFAGIMTGLTVPSIYRGYASFIEKTRKKMSIRLEDIIEMREEQDED